jgi:hemerythrin-like domain-containing protein
MAAAFEQTPETARGRTMYRSLLMVHAHIRRDLEIVQRLAAQVLGGMTAEDLQEQLHALKRNSTLWQLQVNCLRYCSFVHLHHHAEDTHFFGELRATNPAINPVVERLEADHRRISDDLDATEAAAGALERDDSREARQAVVDALDVLRQNLLAHLDYEELSIEATVLRMRDLP